MIAVTGATGQLGRLVVRLLAGKALGEPIVALVRDPKKADAFAALGVSVRVADYDKPEAWGKALAGVDKLLLISASEVGQRARQHATVIEAAKGAGIKLLVYTSLLHAESSTIALADEHRQTERVLRTSGIPSVILRNGWYTENHLMALPAALGGGAVYGCAGAGRFSSAARADFAEAAVAVLTSSGHVGKTYELAGDQSYSLEEYAAELARQSGRPVKYVNMPEADFARALAGAGLPPPLAALLANADIGASKGDLLEDGRQLSSLIGRPTTPLTVVVKAALGSAS